MKNEKSVAQNLVKASEMRNLPPPTKRNTLFITSRENPKRIPLGNYKSAILYRLLGGEDVVYLSGAGSAIPDVVALASFFEGANIGAKVTYGGIENLRKPSIAMPLTNRLVIGLSQKDYFTPKFEFVE